MHVDIDPDPLLNENVLGGHRLLSAMRAEGVLEDILAIWEIKSMTGYRVSGAEEQAGETD